MLLDGEIWLDTNLSPIIAKWIKEYTGVEVKSSHTLSLHYLNDFDNYNRAKEQSTFKQVSKDVDFPQLISSLGVPPKLINLKIGNCDNKALWQPIKPHIKEAITVISSADIDIVDLE